MSPPEEGPEQEPADLESFASATRHYEHFEIVTDADGSSAELGRGAMRTTYRAQDTKLHRAVALKVINRSVAEHPDARARFLREARAVRIVPLNAHEVRGPLSLEDLIMLHPRLERAAMNQITGGDAILPRYAIWAETLRGIVRDAAEKTHADLDTTRNLMRAANSLAAFAAIQWQANPM